MIVSAHGRVQRRLSEDAAIAGWSADGRYLLVVGRLGLRTLWLFDPVTGRGEIVAQTFVRGGVAYQPAGAVWRPGPVPSRADLDLPKRVDARTVETVFPASSFRRGRVRIRHIQPFSLSARADVGDGLIDVSADGRFGVVGSSITTHRSRLTVADLSLGTFRTVAVAASPWFDDDPVFDETGRRVLYRYWNELRSVSVSSGRIQVLARDAGKGPFRRLRDGGIAYFDREHTFVAKHDDGTVVRPQARVGARLARHRRHCRKVATGSYAKGCDVWLANLRTRGVRRFAHGSYSPTRNSWSPTGRRITVAAAWWGDCADAKRGFDWYHAQTRLFDTRGRELDYLPGHVVEWSSDGRYLLTSGGITGSAVLTAQPLVLADLRYRQTSMLMPERATGDAFLLPHRTIIFGRFDNPHTHAKFGDERPRLYLGRLVTR